jgi:predicted metal-dependent HD superfamily phosphohydrolase
MNHFTRASLLKSFAELRVRPSRDLFQELDAAYSAPDRHYHTAHHIDACLAQVHRYRTVATQPAEIEIALWFHDAIYDTRRNDNEPRSADWASQCLTSAGADAAQLSRIRALILATRHAAAADDSDQQLMVDIDLGILGRPRTVFDDYEAAIRREYHWVPWPRYAESRIAVLTGFLDRPFIYATAPLRDRFETQARLNIAHAIARLNDPR